MPLDCVADHRVYIYDRGATNRIGELTSLDRVKWNRTRDDISDAEIDISAEHCTGQEELLSQLEPGRHEVVIFRGNDRVWEGPLNRIAYTRNSVNLFAKDVMYYAFRTIMHGAYSNAYPNIGYACTRAVTILKAELARKEALSPPINVVPYIVNHGDTTGPKTSRVTAPYQQTVFEHIDDMAAKSGIDYTVIGRAIHIWDTDRALGYAPQVTENDFLGELVVTVYGSELATHAAVTTGDHRVGKAGANDAYYGEWERLTTLNDDDDTTAPPPTQDDLNSQAKANLANRKPTPLLVRIPDGSTLNPKGVLQIEDLIPGTHVPMLATLTARTISQTQKIHDINFTETGEGEQITITFTPATTDDTAGAQL